LRSTLARALGDLVGAGRHARAEEGLGLGGEGHDVEAVVGRERLQDTASARFFACAILAPSIEPEVSSTNDDRLLQRLLRCHSRLGEISIRKRALGSPAARCVSRSSPNSASDRP
jgi:hypothetical protein